MIMNIRDYLKARRLTQLVDGVVRNTTLTPEESGYIKEHQRLHALILQAYRDDKFPEPPTDNVFVSNWRQRRAEHTTAPAKVSLSTRYVWTAVSLAAAVLVVLFALIYLFAPAGQPVTAGPAPMPHPEMERNSLPAETTSPPEQTPPDTAVPERDM